MHLILTRDEALQLGDFAYHRHPDDALKVERDTDGNLLVQHPGTRSWHTLSPEQTPRGMREAAQAALDETLRVLP